MSNPTGFSPSTITTGCQLWLDANDPNGNSTLPANNTVITSWIDKSGLGNNLTGSNSPRWFQTPSRMSNASSAFFSGPGPTSYNMTAFFVYFDANVNTCAPVYTANDPASTDVTGLFPNCSGTTFLQTSGGWATQTATITKNTSNLLSIHYSSASNTNNALVYFNGTLNFTASSSPFTRTSFTLGRRVNEIMTGNYYEVLFYNTFLSTTDRQTVEGYLAWKWGLQTSLPSTHPYRNNPFLITLAPIMSIPTNTFIIPVNTYSTIKTFTLPVVSTNPGRMFILKDHLGFAGSNNIYLSTQGLDRIEQSNISSLALSNAFGAWTFMNDGLTNWFLMDAYRNSLFIQSNSTFTPTSITGGFMWLDANALGGSDGTSITTWTSATPLYSYFMTGTATLRTGILNGLKVMQFSTSQNMSLSAGITSTTFTFFFVSRQTGGTNRRVFIGNGNKLYGYWGGGKSQLFMEGWISAVASPASDTAWDIYTITRNSSGGGNFWRYGNTLYTFGSSGGGLDGFYVNTGGCCGGETSDCQIAEVILYNTTLTDAQCRQVEGYLAWKWGLQANLVSGHPHQTAPP
jgi:hypothetical protein